jgi:lysophospholipase L1-like esterase
LFRSQLICWLALKLDRLAGNEQEQNPFLRVTPPQRADAFRGNFWNSASLKNMELLERNLKTMRGICREYGATFVAATMHYFERDKLRDQVNARLREFYRRESIPFFDADQKIPKGDKSINTDEVHFTRDGTELMAAGFAEIVAVALPQKPERTHNENRN